MTRPTFGQPLRPGVTRAALAIVAQCHDPQATTAKLERGEATPCYRCLAYTTAHACHFETRRLTR